MLPSPQLSTDITRSMQNQVTACLGRYYRGSLGMVHRLPTGKGMGTANLRENIRTPFVSEVCALRVSPFAPVLVAPRFRIATSFCIEALHRQLCFPLPTPSHPSLYKLFGDFSLFARPTFLHRGDPPGWQDGHCDPSRLKAALLRSNLLLPAAPPLQLVSRKSQGHRPQGCGKQHLAQAWREPQLREDRL